MTCLCPRYEFEIEGVKIAGEAGREPDCPKHGYPDDKWRTGDPLYRHARIVERATGRTLTRGEAHAVALEATRRADAKAGRETVMACDGYEWERRFREETPREVEARLLAESRAA